MTAMVFERLQFGIMMLLSQGISYWDAPGLLAAQWTDPQQGKQKNTSDISEVALGRPKTGAHIPPSLHSSTFRASDGVGLGFELASPSARLSMSGKAGIDLRRGSLADSESSDYMPVPETVAGAFAAGYRREAFGEEAAEEQRAVGKPPMPTPPERDPSAAPEASPRRTGGAGRTLSAADGPSWQPEESPTTYSAGPVGSGQHAAAAAARGSGKAKVHDPNRLALYQHESSSYGLEIRLSKSEQWRANQERPAFRTCFQLWGYAKAMQLVADSAMMGATAVGGAMVKGGATRRPARTPLQNSKRTTARLGQSSAHVSVL